MDWIDIAAILFLAFSAWNGWRRGLINELSGFLALAAAGLAGLTYGGQLDGFGASTLHLGPGSAHVAGLLLFASGAYLIVWSIGLAANTVAKLPVLNLANAALGSLLAAGKTVAILFIAAVVATFAPLSPDLRADVNASAVGHVFSGAGTAIAGDLGSKLPGYLRPFWDSAVRPQTGVPADSPGRAEPDASP